MCCATGLDGVLSYGYMGFNVSNPYALYSALQPYYMTDADMQRLAGRPVLVYDPALDTLAGNQSQIFFAALPRVRSPASTLLQLNPQRGTGSLLLLLLPLYAFGFGF